MLSKEESQKLVTLNSYEVSASQYAQNTADFHPVNEAEKLMQALPKHAKILDIGCGPGRDAKVFSSRGFNVVGIDFSANMIELARKNAPSGAFYVMDIEEFSFPEASFEAVWANAA